MLVQAALGCGNLDKRAFDGAEESAMREQLMREAGTHWRRFSPVPGSMWRSTHYDELREFREHVVPMALAIPALAEI
jgi:hypothetical protein